MIDMIILGFLSIRDLSGYEVQRAIRESINYFYTSSSGSIHPALVRIEKAGWAEVREESRGKRSRKIYSLNREGRRVFQEWLAGDIEPQRIRENSLLKIFFFGMTGEQDRIRIISHYLEELKRTTEELVKLRDSLEGKECPGEFREISRFQNETLRFGIESSRFMESWFGDFLENGLKESENE